MVNLAEEMILWKNSNRAFTLVELLVAIAILGIMAAIATPSMQKMAGEIRLKSSARKISTLLRHAKEEAALSGRTYIVNLTLPNHYELGIESNLPELPEMAQSILPSIQGQLEEGISFSEFQGERKETSSDRIFVTFNENGMVTPANVYLTAQNISTKYSVKVNYSGKIFLERKD
ncbi:MAG: prepilin-type N-terminal cleavage/methylation domain-containing protein [Candidatus Brocadiae bacterium]|nr:prepilin-type N-terminal cleavage/methylation domain-containing protein [Candidatus Brocadiia bacterium]